MLLQLSFKEIMECFCKIFNLCGINLFFFSLWFLHFVMYRNSCFHLNWCLQQWLLHLMSGGRCSFLSLFVSVVVLPSMCFLLSLNILLFILVVYSGTFMVFLSFAFVIPYILFVLDTEEFSKLFLHNTNVIFFSHVCSLLFQAQILNLLLC